MKIIRFIIISLLLCVMFQFSANAENTEPLDKALGDAMVAIAKKDFEKAAELLEPLVEQDNIRAKGMLGKMYCFGTGVEQDMNKGMAMIMDAAKKGDEDAKKSAVDLNHELASNGDEKAMYNMGYMCLKGWGGGDYESDKCLVWLEKSAEMGNSNSAKFLAYIYKNGKYGITADQNKADFWSKQSQQVQQSKK